METKWCQSCMLTEMELVWNRWERNITNFIPKGQQCGSTKEKKTLKIPGGRYEQRPVSETMTLVGKDPSNFSSALKKKKILPELVFKNISSPKVGPVVHQHIWLPNHVGREPANNVLISNSKHPYIGFIFTHYKVGVSSISIYDFILCAMCMYF